MQQACDVLLPSAGEETTAPSDADEETACRRLVERGTPIVVLERGTQGCVVFTDNEIVKVNFASEMKGTCMACLLAAVASSDSIDVRQVFPCDAGSDRGGEAPVAPVRVAGFWRHPD